MAREPGFRQGRRRARSAIKCQRSAGPVWNDSNAQALKLRATSAQARTRTQAHKLRGPQALAARAQAHRLLDKVSGSKHRGSG